MIFKDEFDAALRAQRKRVMKRPFQLQTLSDDGKTWWRSGNPHATKEAAIAQAQQKKTSFRHEFGTDEKFRVVNLETRQPVWEDDQQS